MSTRDNKGRFVKVTNDTEHKCSGKCTCKEAKKSMNEKKKRFEKLRRDGVFSVDGYEVPLNPGFLEKYLSALAAAYPENVHVSYEDEEGEVEDDRHNVVICLGEDPFCDDPEAPKAVWDSGTEIIHIDPKNHKVWIEYPEGEGEEEDVQTRENKDAYEHFRMLEKARDKIMKEREEREKARAKSSENPPEFLKIMSDFFDWCEKNGR